MAGDRGFEPRLSDSESDVLPLDESPVGGDHSSIEVDRGQTCTGTRVEERLSHLFLVIGIICSHANQRRDSIFLWPGASIYNGWATDFYSLDNTEQSYRMAGTGGLNDSVNIKTKDGADVSLDVAINYRLVADPSVIRDRVIPECGLEKVEMRVTQEDGRRGRATSSLELVDAYKLKWVRDYSRSVIRYKFGELTPKSFYVASERNIKAQESVEELNRLLQPHGIDVRLVVAERFSFYEEFENIINQKKAAEQEVKKQESLAKAATQAQKREETKATATANVAIARMEGQLRKAILEVEAEAAQGTKAAEAYAYKTQTQADAEFYKAKNEAQSILAKAKAEAKGLELLAQSLSGEGASNLVKLEYAKALRGARITGVPYATDPRIQKVEISPEGALGGTRGGQR